MRVALTGTLTNSLEYTKRTLFFLYLVVDTVLDWTFFDFNIWFNIFFKFSIHFNFPAVKTSSLLTLQIDQTLT